MHVDCCNFRDIQFVHPFTNFKIFSNFSSFLSKVMKIDVWKLLETHENFLHECELKCDEKLPWKEVKRGAFQAIGELLFFISLWSPSLIWFSVSTHFIKAKVVIFSLKAAISQLSHLRQTFLLANISEEISRVCWTGRQHEKPLKEDWLRKRTKAVECALWSSANFPFTHFLLLRS